MQEASPFSQLTQLSKQCVFPLEISLNLSRTGQQKSEASATMNLNVWVIFFSEFRRPTRFKIPTIIFTVYFIEIIAKTAKITHLEQFGAKFVHSPMKTAPEMVSAAAIFICEQTLRRSKNQYCRQIRAAHHPSTPCRYVTSLNLVPRVSPLHVTLSLPGTWRAETLGTRFLNHNFTKKRSNWYLWVAALFAKACENIVLRVLLSPFLASNLLWASSCFRT